MADLKIHSNKASSILDGSITDIVTIISVVDASSFPVPSGSQFAAATIYDGTNLEIIHYTGVSGNNFTGVTRGQEGTSNFAFNDAITIQQNVTADDVDRKQQEIDGLTLTEKVTPVSGDKFLMQDSAASDELKWVDSDSLPGGGGDLVDDLTPQLGGFLDVNGNFIGHSTSGATAYSIASDGTSLATYGVNANYVHAFTNSGWSVQWGTSFNRMEFDISTDMRVYTNNVLRITVNDSGLTLGATTAVSGILDEDTMSSDSATDLATQQSIKAYVDVIAAASTTGFNAYASTNQSLTALAGTKVQLDTEVFDSGGLFDSTTNYRYTPDVAGVYYICYNCVVTSPVSGQYLLGQAYKNGTSIAYARNNNGTDTSFLSVYGGAMIEMNGTTDYIEFFVLSSTSLNITSGQVFTWMSGVLVEAS